MLSKENLVNIGYISRTHSFKGEIQFTINKKIVPLKRGDFLFIRLEGQFIPYKIVAIKGKDDEPIVGLEFIANYDDAVTQEDLSKDDTEKSKSKEKKSIKEHESQARLETKKSLDELYEYIDDRRREDWFSVYINAIVEEFEKVRKDLAKGRQGENEEEGLDEQQLPFYDFIIFSAFKDENVTEEEKEALKELTIELVNLLQITLTPRRQ